MMKLVAIKLNLTTVQVTRKVLEYDSLNLANDLPKKSEKHSETLITNMLQSTRSGKIF